MCGKLCQPRSVDWSGCWAIVPLHDLPRPAPDGHAEQHHRPARSVNSIAPRRVPPSEKSFASRSASRSLRFLFGGVMRWSLPRLPHASPDPSLRSTRRSVSFQAFMDAMSTDRPRTRPTRDRPIYRPTRGRTPRGHVRDPRVSAMSRHRTKRLPDAPSVAQLLPGELEEHVIECHGRVGRAPGVPSPGATSCSPRSS